MRSMVRTMLSILHRLTCMENDGVGGKNLVSWTTIIFAYTQQRYGEEAIQLFKEMHLQGISPDTITLVSSLGAYANLKAAAEH